MCSCACVCGAALVAELLREDTQSLLRLGSNLSLAAGYMQLRQSPTLLPHTAAIIARAAVLEQYAPGILLAIDGQLALIEPHLDTILDRLDEIEPHMPFVLENLDALAPHTGSILDHFDALMLYADEDGVYLQQLLPYISRFAPLFDLLGPHLALLRPHLPKLIRHLDVIAPYASRFAPHLTVSANADVLLFYWGWVLRIPLLGPAVLRLPFLPRLAAFFARRLPRWPVRGRTANLRCDYEECDLVQYEARLAGSRSYRLAGRNDSPTEALPRELEACCADLPPLPSPLPRPLPRARGDDVTPRRKRKRPSWLQVGN